MGRYVIKVDGDRIITQPDWSGEFSLTHLRPHDGDVEIKGKLPKDLENMGKADDFFIGKLRVFEDFLCEKLKLGWPESGGESESEETYNKSLQNFQKHPNEAIIKHFRELCDLYNLKEDYIRASTFEQFAIFAEKGENFRGDIKITSSKQVQQVFKEYPYPFFRFGKSTYVELD